MFLITGLVYGTVTVIQLLFIVMLNESLKQDIKIWSKDRNFLFLKWYDSNLVGRLKSPILPRDMSSFGYCHCRCNQLREKPLVVKLTK